MTDAVVPFTGWGRGTWGELAFGEGSITNAGASGQVGSVTIVAEANVACDRRFWHRADWRGYG
jgi:hypothetical protein